MKRVAILADSHYDETSRFEETKRLHNWILDDIERRGGVEAILHAGDVFERKSTPAERMAFARWVVRAANMAPVVIVRGNHDALSDLQLFSRLDAKHRIVVEEACGVHTINGMAIGCIAWPRRSELLAVADGVEADEMLRHVIRGLGNEMAEHRWPRILLAHAMVRGSVTSTGQPLVGCDMEIGTDDLALSGAHLVALGHIHKAQEWQHDGIPIVYPGSVRRTAFGEEEAKSYILASFDEDRLVSWERVEVPATPMMLFEGAWSEGEARITSKAFPWPDQVRGAECRLRYEVASEDRDAARRAFGDLRDQILENGAVMVKLEEVVIATTRARVPEITTAITLEDKLRLLWRARGIEMNHEREARLLARLPEVEAA